MPQIHTVSTGKYPIDLLFQVAFEVSEEPRMRRIKFLRLYCPWLYCALPKSNDLELHVFYENGNVSVYIYIHIHIYIYIYI